MKASFFEHGGCFAVCLEAETKEEVVKLARFGIGKTKELRTARAEFTERGTAEISIVIGKKKSGATSI